MTFIHGIRRACATLALSAAIGTAGATAASAQDLSPPPTSFSLGLVGAYALVGGSLVDFVGGGLERAFVIGAGLVMGAASPGSGPFAQLSYGIEADSINMTGTGSGWGIDRVRGAVHGGSASVRYTALAGLARTRGPFGSETGYSVGLRVNIYLSEPTVQESTGIPPQYMNFYKAYQRGQEASDAAFEVTMPRNADDDVIFAREGGPGFKISNPATQFDQLASPPPGPSLFLQANYNDTGTFRTRDLGFGISIRF